MDQDIDEEKARLLLETTGGPGGCSGMDECEVFCSTPGNDKVCMTFAVDSGMMDEDRFVGQNDYQGSDDFHRSPFYENTIPSPHRDGEENNFSPQCDFRNYDGTPTIPPKFIRDGRVPEGYKNNEFQNQFNEEYQRQHQEQMMREFESRTGELPPSDYGEVIKHEESVSDTTSSNDNSSFLGNVINAFMSVFR